MPDSPQLDPLSRVLAHARNGRKDPDGDDLDWVLFRSFPDGDVSWERFAEAVPVFQRALDTETTFDHELLFVRLIEAGDAVSADARRDIARSVADRVLANGFEPDDAISVLRFALRVLPDADKFISDLTSDTSLDRLRFLLTVDFVLDERELDDYLSLSYLRDADPDSAPLLAGFPIHAGALEQLERMFSDRIVREQLHTGWARHTEPWEREALAKAFSVKLPGFVPEDTASS